MRTTVASAVAASLIGAPPLLAAQDEEVVGDQGLMTVTGSRIQRVDFEGPSPVSVISGEDIDASGEISVAEVLHGSTFNQFGSFQTRSGDSRQSTSTMSLRGLGAARTLVLLDGRRVSGAPSFEAGSAQNLNVIPLEAVERIEVLRDGASAIYGSDAIGGVVNIILRKDYEGMQLNGHIGRPTQSGGDEESYGLVGGVSSGQGNITFAMDHEAREIIFNGDRSFSAIGLSPFGFPATFFAGTVNTDGEFVSLGTFADPRCPATLGGAEFPESVFTELRLPDGTPVASLCAFNYAATAATEAAIERDSLFVNANYEIAENAGFFARGVFTKVDSFGRYAPPPFVPLPIIGANNPNNPTAPGAVMQNPNEGNPVLLGDDYSQYDLDGDGAPDFIGPFDLTLLYRNIPGGFRDGLVEDTLVDFLAGVEGSLDILGGTDWEFAGQHSTQVSNQASTGLGFVNILQDAIDDGSFDVFGVNGPTDFSAVNPSANHTGLANSEHRVAGVDGQATFDLAQMANGALSAAAGFEYRDEKFLQDFDDQQVAGNVAGAVSVADVSGARTVSSLFAEVSVPILERLELSLAARHDDYNDFGTTVNPKIAAGFRPIDSLLLRSSYGKGFRAPSMTQLYSAPLLEEVEAIDRTRCFNSGQQNVPPEQLPPGHPCNPNLFTTFSGGNAALDAERSENFNLGVVWNPLSDLSASFDYYDIELQGEVGRPPLQEILDAEFAENMGGTRGNADVLRLPNGRIRFVRNNNANIAATETQGYDVDLRYGFTLDAVGDFQSQLLLSKVTKFVNDQGDGLGLRRLSGAFDPDLRAALSLTWSRGDLSATAIGSHITRTDDGLGTMLASWTTWDVQFGWATPWSGRISVGARNLFDRDPPTSSAADHPFYSQQLHDVFGRVPFIRYEQKL